MDTCNLEFRLKSLNFIDHWLIRERIEKVNSDNTININSGQLTYMMKIHSLEMCQCHRWNQFSINNRRKTFKIHSTGGRHLLYHLTVNTDPLPRKFADISSLFYSVIYRIMLHHLNIRPKISHIQAVTLLGNYFGTSNINTTIIPTSSIALVRIPPIILIAIKTIPTSVFAKLGEFFNTFESNTP